MATRASVRAPTSASMCVASARRANDRVRKPAAASTTRRATVRARTAARRFRFALRDGRACSCISLAWRSCRPSSTDERFLPCRMNRVRFQFVVFAAALCAGRAAAEDAPTLAEDAKLPPDSVWSLHAQTTYQVQTHGAFSAPYEGENSFQSRSETRGSFTATVFLGRRLWTCLLYTSDAADEEDSVDLGGR